MEKDIITLKKYIKSLEDDPGFLIDLHHKLLLKEINDELCIIGMNIITSYLSPATCTTLCRYFNFYLRESSIVNREYTKYTFEHISKI